MNAPWRQVSTYWEMVYGMVKHDIVHAGYFLESNAEGLVFYAKMLPFLAEIRRDSNPASFRNTEWVATAVSRGAADLRGGAGPRQEAVRGARGQGVASDAPTERA
jgi:hypothetical protein